MYRTFIEIAGKKAMPKHTLDGVSLVKLWKNPDAKLGRDAIYFHFPGYLEGGKGDWRTTPAGMMRAGDFTLLEFFEDGRLELYNVKDDLGQKQNLVKAMPEKTGRSSSLGCCLTTAQLALAIPQPRLIRSNMSTSRIEKSRPILTRIALPSEQRY